MPDHEAARAMWESGVSLAATAKEFGVSATTISNWKKKEGWSRDTTPVDEPESGPSAPFGFDEGETKAAGDVINDSDVEIQRLARELAQAQAQLREAQEALDEERAVVEVKLPRSAVEVEEWIGEDRLEEIVELKLAALNRERSIRGQYPLDWRQHPEMWDRTKSQVLEEVLDARTKFTEATLAPLRVVKMWFNGTIVQVPHELQFNNEAAQAGAAIWKMRDKGAKLIMPVLCVLHNCWLEAATHPDGSPLYNWYCSPEHARRDPYGSSPTEGVSTRGGRPSNVMDLTGRA